MVKLFEILDVIPLPFKWENNETAYFKFEDTQLRIDIDSMMLTLKSEKPINVANVSFGKIKNNKELDTALTGYNKPRTILSTVVNACVNNKSLMSHDIICFASSDDKTDIRGKRFMIYNYAVNEFKRKYPEFSFDKDLAIKTSNGTIAVLLSKVEFSKEDSDWICENLVISKFDFPSDSTLAKLKNENNIT